MAPFRRLSYASNIVRGKNAITDANFLGKYSHERPNWLVLTKLHLDNAGTFYASLIRPFSGLAVALPISK